ncbi:RNAse Z [Methanothermus fervidus DSM 2088]|uniref:Ribonuclease Z n=1 Tax=Methanothermus fervidus (strain ATCC 43054 / DSM 2088 / JCM 10308 / V24 S) TaxID=523846 RepID=E3GZ11_METFV|nr:RNAse Z [Methanothermus fervidus DSM 2088]
MMEVVFLGTSSAVPSKYRNHASIAIKGFGEIFLFDCGEGTQRQMAIAKVSPMKVKRIFISHLHGDHILGIPGLIQSMGFRNRKKPLTIYGPPGIKEVKEAMMKLGEFSIDFDINVKEIKNEGIVFENEKYKIECIKTKHTTENYSYSIEEKKRPRFLREKAIKLGVKPGPAFSKLHRGIPVKVGDRIVKPEEVLGKPRKGIKVVYSGDTVPHEKMIEFAKDADLLIHDSTFEAGKENKALETGHSTAKDAAKIAKEANVKYLVLTHLSTRYREAKKIENDAKKIFKKSIVAEDLMSITIVRKEIREIKRRILEINEETIPRSELKFND